MTKITVFLEGTLVTECELVQGKEYVLGRASTCDIVISHPKVSRQHAKLFFDGHDWQCAILSKYGHLMVNGHVMTEDFGLAPGSQFSIPPFEIKFTMGDGQTEPLPPAGTPEGALEQSSTELSDKTKTGAVQLKIILCRLDEQGKTTEEINLGPETLVAGRSKSCNFRLTAPEASRRHFIIEPSGPDYVLTDLDSANKTYVNGQAVQRHVLQSGDEIRVGSEKFRFEQLNPNLEQVPNNVPDVGSPAGGVPFGRQNTVPMVYPVASPQGANGPQGGHQPAVIKMAPGGQMPMTYYPPPSPYPVKGAGKKKNKNKMVQMALLAVLVLVIAIEFTGNKKDEPAGNLTSGSSEGPAGKPADATGLERLTPEQRRSIDETYNLAMTLYTTGKYDLAAIELGKIFQLVNNYKDARNIQALCQQALAIKKQQDDANRMKAEQEALKQQVNQVLDHCEALLKAKRYDEVEPCAGQISDRDPDNERAQQLVLSAKQAQAHIEESREHALLRERRKKHALELLGRAEKDYRAKRYIASVKEFESVEHMASLDSASLKAKAKTGAAAAKEKIQKQSEALVNSGKEALDSKNYKDAYSKFNQALKIYAGNGDAQVYKDQALRELHLQEKNLYDESVIEEDLGNIESAKKKWHTILRDDLKFDDIYQKAQIKLRKYEK